MNKIEDRGEVITVVISTEKGDYIQYMNPAGNLRWQNIENVKIFGLMILSGEYKVVEDTNAK